MLSNKKIEEVVGAILLSGMLVSLLFVLLGGSWYLLQHGHEPLSYEFLPIGTYKLNPALILQTFFTFSPLGLIEFGLLCLVLTQLIRVAYLVVFYLIILDLSFVFISAFILLVLVYSLFLRHYSF